MKALHAVLLAAGAGRRLGAPKAGLHVRGRWMLPRLVHALRLGGAERVVLVLSELAVETIADLGDPEADVEVRNPDPDRGRTSSILAGLEAVPADAAGVLVHPCDVPLLSGEAVARLVHAWSASPQPSELVARPVTRGGKGGHPLLIGSERLAELRAFGPDQPLRELVHADPVRRLDVVLQGDPGPFLDVNTPEQQALLESLLDPAP